MGTTFSVLDACLCEEREVACEWYYVFFRNIVFKRAITSM
jgi:hypothetical protein